MRKIKEIQYYERLFWVKRWAKKFVKKHKKESKAQFEAWLRK